MVRDAEVLSQEFDLLRDQRLTAPDDVSAKRATLQRLHRLAVSCALDVDGS